VLERSVGVVVHNLANIERLDGDAAAALRRYGEARRAGGPVEGILLNAIVAAHLRCRELTGPAARSAERRLAQMIARADREDPEGLSRLVRALPRGGEITGAAGSTARLLSLRARISALRAAPGPGTTEARAAEEASELGSVLTWLR
jgi:hypothetical protein